MTGRERRLIAELETLITHIEKGKSTKLKDLVQSLDPSILELVTETGRLVKHHREAAPPYDLSPVRFLACVEAMELSIQDLEDGYRPCIVAAGQRGPRYCYVRPNGKLHMGPNVPT